jgi:hypothetical protein
VHLPTAVLAAAGLLCCALSGCSVNGGGLNVPTVSRTALQQDIAQRLADAGEKPESVTCQQDLVGEVGTTAHCEVVVSASNKARSERWPTVISMPTACGRRTP